VRSVELFAGAGGLALGMAKAGFHHAMVLEWDHDACETIRANQRLGETLVQGWPVHQGDARAFDYKSVKGTIDVVSGGPPCQPFSLGGKHRAYNDARDMFPEAVRAVRELQPRAFVFENVKGLTRESFSSYFEYIRLQMQYPELIARNDESWEDHLVRLEKHHTALTRGRRTRAERGLEYNVLTRLLNSANYGIPQRRERVFFVGIRNDLGIEWNFPDPTHSAEQLLVDQYVTGTYWDRHSVSKKRRPEAPPKLAARISRLREIDAFEPDKAWRTVRDAIHDLPDPELSPAKARLIPNHQFNDGARPYPGHTGSPLDEPAKTLKAGDHGVPGGENMLLRPDGSVRYFSVREAARLQSFPDDYTFTGSWSEIMRQLGNAVPVDLAEVVARSVAKVLTQRK
jgi:DNA (cytosine-5)-methyltransferase 1